MAKWITPVELTSLTTGAWTSLDISNYLPVGANPTGIMLQYNDTKSNVGDLDVGFRKTGSTDNRIEDLSVNNRMYCSIGVDYNGSFDYYIESSLICIYLVGYFEDDAVFFDNAIEITPSTASSYQTVDISSNTNSDAIGAILEITVSTTSTRSLGIRPYGSTDDFYSSMTKCHYGYIVGVDSEERLEIKKQDTSIKIYLVGYIKSGVTFLTNATDMTLSNANVFEDLDALPEGATGGFFNVVITSSSYSNVLREKGSLGDDKDIYQTTRGQGIFVKCDDNRIIEGKVSATSIKFNLLGYSLDTSSSNAVSKEMQLKYELFNLINKNLVTNYNVYNLINKESQINYGVYNAINKESELKYNIYYLINKELQNKYNINNLINSEIQQNHNIYELLNKEIQLNYHISTTVGSISKELQLNYDIYQLISKETELNYNVFGLVNKENELKYHIYTTTNKEIQSNYNIFNSIHKELQLLYNSFELISSTTQPNYNIYNIINSELQIVYNLFNKIQKELQQIYTIYSLVNSEVELEYNIHYLISKTTQLKYHLDYLQTYIELIGRFTEEVSLKGRFPEQIDLLGRW